MRRPSGSLLISVVLHIVLGAGLIWVLGIPYSFHDWMGLTPAPKEQAESITYVALPSAGGAGGVAAEQQPLPSGAPGPPPLPRAPSTVPGRIPAPGAARPGGQPSSGGAGGGGNGLRQGISPSFEDPRVWLPPGQVPGVPRTPSERLDSALASVLRTHQDSLNALAEARGRDPGDWTFEKGGKKWGMDRNKIYIGDHSIPTAILALLPLNSGTNPIKNREERILNSQRQEIMEQAQRAMNEAEFREAVRKIRERKEREHQAELARKKAAEEARAAGEQPIP